MCPMPGDDVRPSAIPGPRPSHHSGPGYVANPKAPDFELDEPRMERADFQAQADAEVRVHDSETGGSSGEPVDVVLLPDKSRVERGVDPDRRWHLEGPSTGGGDSGNLFGGLGGDFAAGARSRVSFGTRFVLYQRNIENLCKDRATLGEEIRKSVAELFDAALEPHATIAIKGVPEQHAEGANVPADEDS
jgi:hypothetical protein